MEAHNDCPNPGRLGIQWIASHIIHEADRSSPAQRLLTLSKRKPCILIFSRFYLPGYKAGGPIRSISNIVHSLGDTFDFKIVTSDRDSGDVEPYPNIQQDGWTESGNAMVRYLSPSQKNIRSIRKVFKTVDYDAIYLNSFFCPLFSILPIALLRLNLIRRRPVILAPRGEFSEGAMRIKPIRKRVFCSLAKMAGGHRNIIWQATSEGEAADITRRFGEKQQIELASNLTSNQPPGNTPIAEKQKGMLRLTFLSRVTPKKNLLGAIRMLADVPGDIEFDIYGPASDISYLKECKAAAETLPPSKKIRWLGAIANHEVGQMFARYHAFLFPSWGENFGHVIAEALQAGCPVITTDRTPWHKLTEAGAGWSLPLESPDGFRTALQALVEMDGNEHRQLVARVKQFAEIHLNADENQTIEAHHNLFLRAII